MAGPEATGTSKGAATTEAAQAKARVRRKVTATHETVAATASYVKADVFYSFRGFSDALSYWLPMNLNKSVETARSFRKLVS